jgi:hypothetical protein
MQVSEDTVNRELICEWLLRPVAIDVIDRARATMIGSTSVILLLLKG